MKNLKQILYFTLVALIVVLFFQNVEESQVRFLFWSVTTRRIFILCGVLAIGIFLGWLLRGYADARAKAGVEEKTDVEDKR